MMKPMPARARALMFGAAMLALAACARDPASDAAADAHAEAADEAASEASEVAAAAADEASGRSAASVTGARPSVAPGVAFTYSFRFRLPDAAVSEAQNRHIAACEELGRNRCRVNGVSYRQDDGGQIRAALSLLVDPALARSFVRDAAASVAELDGETMNSEVSGVDVGTGITDSQARSAALGGDLERIEERLRAPGLSASERAELQAQVAQLRGELRGEEFVRRGDERRLAATPVDFGYFGNTGAAGIDSSRPFGSALEASSGAFGTMSAWLLTVIGLLLPWALLLGAFVGIWHLLRRRKSAPPVQE